MKINKCTKKFLIMSIVFLFGFLSSAIAGTIYRTIQVQYEEIKINVNGERKYPELEPFTYSGRTFVPLRFIAEELNKEVLWDGVYKIIDVNDKVSPSIKPINLKGTGNTATNKFALIKGLARFQISYSSSNEYEYFRIELLNSDGKLIDFIVSEALSDTAGVRYNGSKAINIPRNGEYLLNIDAKGDWTITIE
jgi:hypothetical protein